MRVLSAAGFWLSLIGPPKPLRCHPHPGEVHSGTEGLASEKAKDHWEVLEVRAGTVMNGGELESWGREQTSLVEKESVLRQTRVA